MKYVIYLLIWLNCYCPSNNITLTSTPAIMTQDIYTFQQDKPRCDTQVKYADSLDPIIDQMTKEHKTYGLVQPRTVPDRIYKLTMKGGKVIDQEPVEIEPIIEKRMEWIEKEEKTIKGFKVKE